ncbi:dihydropteroate synthase [Kitasatospora sp. NPDC002227]|uniref:dihydropteroate synthase n=1 Tax=Kitasatospora sp. NPDC002227 TaxID=3154773 RepID=UPI00333003F3
MNNLPGLPALDRCAVMGIVNVTPDSFSDGGLWLDPAAAVRHGLDLTAKGADLVDVGGESTRPGAQRVTEAEELRRVIPVVRELAAAGVVVSVDTMRAAVAEQAVAAGARLVNDVSGGLADPGMAEVVAATGAPFVVMHWRGQSADMDRLAVYEDVVTDVAAELSARVAQLLAAGVKEEQLVLDPGLGFAKTLEHNWELLGGLHALTSLGRPVLVAASRKRFLGTLLADPETGELRPARQRDDATAAVSALAAQAGAWAVRVHDVAGTADAVRVVAAWQRAAGGRA